MTETTPAPSSSSVVVMVVAVVVVGGARTIPLSVKLTTTIVVCAISWAIGWVHFWVTRLPLGGVAIVWRKATWRKATSLRKATLLLRRGCGVPFALIVITHLYTWLPPKARMWKGQTTPNQLKRSFEKSKTKVFAFRTGQACFYTTRNSPPTRKKNKNTLPLIMVTEWTLQ